VSADPAILDAAVRAFLRENPMRGYCTCFGCVVTINANYRALLADVSRSDSATPPVSPPPGSDQTSSETKQEGSR
jgi:hypothetical protein